MRILSRCRWPVPSVSGLPATSAIGATAEPVVWVIDAASIGFGIAAILTL